MKILLFVLTVTTISQLSFAQEKESFYVFDADWKQVDVKDAVYMLHIKQKNDTCWQWDYYNMWGPRIKTERFKDKDGKIPHGSFSFYNKKGLVDTIGYFDNGLASDTWYAFNDSGSVVEEEKYEKDVLIWRRDAHTLDSINKIKTREHRAGKKIIEKESEFPGGISKWLRYLNKSLKYPKRAFVNKIQGTVIVDFIVNKDGDIEDPHITQSVEYSLDEEALRMITGSPRWKPASKDGNIVKSFKRQPIVFRFQ